MARRTVLVTGASGFIGRAVVARLRKSWPSVKVVGVARRNSRQRTAVVPCDLTKPKLTQKLLNRFQPEIIFHCAGTTVPGPASRLRAAHIRATKSLLDAAQKMERPPRVVVIGSAAEYGNVPSSHRLIRETEKPRPQSAYAVSKNQQTRLALTYIDDLDVVVARVFNVLGPDLPEHFAVGSFARLLSMARRNPRRVWSVGPLNAVRDFISVEDAARAILAVAVHGKTGEIYNVCSGKGVSMGDILKEMMKIWSVSFEVRSNADGSKRTAVSRAVGDPSKIRQRISWRAKDSWRTALKQSLLGKKSPRG